MHPTSSGANPNQSKLIQIILGGHLTPRQLPHVSMSPSLHGTSPWSPLHVSMSLGHISMSPPPCLHDLLLKSMSPRRRISKAPQNPRPHDPSPGINTPIAKRKSSPFFSNQYSNFLFFSPLSPLFECRRGFAVATLDPLLTQFESLQIDRPQIAASEEIGC